METLGIDLVKPAKKELTYVLYHAKNASQVDRVFSVLTDHSFDRPLTLEAISKLTRIKPASSVASRIRDIRAHGYHIQKARVVGAKGAQAFTYLMVS